MPGIIWDASELEGCCQRAAVMGLQLLPWQIHALAVLLARRRPDGSPATRYALWVVARSAGKTALVTHLMEYFLSEGKDTELYAVATKQEKATIIHERLSKLHGGEERWKFSGGGASTGIAMVRHKKAVLRCMPCTDAAMDGIVPRFVVADEAARMDAAILRGMSSAIKTASGQMLMITTPDVDQKTRELWPHWHRCEQALDQGQPFASGWWALLWGMDASDDPESELAVRHANPSIGQFPGGKSVEFVLQTISDALATGDPKAREEVFTQELATFTDDLAGAVPLELLDRVSIEEDWDLLAGAPAVVAIDFAQGGHFNRSQCDLTSLALAVWDGARVHTRGWHWWAGADIAENERRTRQPLSRWAADGHLTMCGGPTLDFDLVEARLVDIARQFKILAFICDPVGKATAWAAKMERDHGWVWHKARQDYLFMGGGFSIWDNWIRSERIVNKPDPVLRACLASTKLMPNANGTLWMPSKAKSGSNIDAVTAQIMACKVLHDLEIMNGSIYETNPGF